MVGVSMVGLGYGMVGLGCCRGWVRYGRGWDSPQAFRDLIIFFLFFFILV